MSSAEHLIPAVRGGPAAIRAAEPYVRVGDWSDVNGVLTARPVRPSVESIEVTRVWRYPIVIGCGTLDGWVGLMGPATSTARAAWVVADAAAWDHHRERLLGAPGATSLVRDVLVLEVSERSKSMGTWEGVIDWLSERRVGRRDVVVTFGGAALSDVVGFAASAYMRGIDYVNVPTTFVAQVDGAMGGKVAVNTHRAKNLVGSFHQPAGVLSDPTVLSSLPAREIACGLAEVIKTFAIESEQAFSFLERHLDACLDADVNALDTVVRACAAIKMHLLEDDPFEEDLRRVLNFGHTLAHPVETVFGYRGVRHGEAVAVGMATAARIGVARGLTSPWTAERLVGTIRRAGLPIGVSASLIPSVLECLDMVGSIRGGSLRYVIPCEIGRLAIVDDCSRDEIAMALPATPAL